MKRKVWIEIEEKPWREFRALAMSLGETAAGLLGRLAKEKVAGREDPVDGHLEQGLLTSDEPLKQSELTSGVREADIGFEAVNRLAPEADDGFGLGAEADADAVGREPVEHFGKARVEIDISPPGDDLDDGPPVQYPRLVPDDTPVKSIFENRPRQRGLRDTDPVEGPSLDPHCPDGGSHWKLARGHTCQHCKGVAK